MAATLLGSTGGRHAARQAAGSTSLDWDAGTAAPARAAASKRPGSRGVKGAGQLQTAEEPQPQPQSESLRMPLQKDQSCRGAPGPEEDCDQHAGTEHQQRAQRLQPEGQPPACKAASEPLACGHATHVSAGPMHAFALTGTHEAADQGQHCATGSAGGAAAVHAGPAPAGPAHGGGVTAQLHAWGPGDSMPKTLNPNPETSNIQPEALCVAQAGGARACCTAAWPSGPCWRRPGAGAALPCTCPGCGRRAGWPGPVRLGRSGQEFAAVGALMVLQPAAVGLLTVRPSRECWPPPPVSIRSRRCP